jgi:ABC-type multidrug transport system fused ATPase/permease subunit
MKKSFQKIYQILTKEERKKAILLLVMILLMALIDVIGIASIMPFMSVLADPKIIKTNIILIKLYSFFDFNDPNRFLFFLGVFVFFVLVISSAFKAVTIYAQTRFTMMREYTISSRLVEKYLHQPYAWYLNKHSSDLGKNILSEVSQVIHGSLIPAILLISQSAVVFTIILFLVLIDYKLAFTISLILGISYGISFYFINNYLSKIGNAKFTSNKVRFNIINEAFGSIKEVKVSALENTYLKRFNPAAESYARYQSSVNVISQMPRFVLEALAFGGMIIVALFLMSTKEGLASALPIMAMYAFAGYRLIPAVQQIYGSITSLKFTNPSLDALNADINGLSLIKTVLSKEPLFFNEKITLEDISFTYPNSSKIALNKINLTIQAKTTIGIAGTTGSGKTTLVDLILGLLTPTNGIFKVDNKEINPSNLKKWQNLIGYVPQQIYLSDDTIASNIAYGVDYRDIDMDSVRRAAEVANLNNYVDNELPEKYNTKVGERGVRLSGGQRQRIGIARALYHNPKLLILDEATSALDNLTEQAVMDAVHNLNREITIIIIAHRLSTIKDCDNIILIDSGKIIDSGNYQELISKNITFREMSEV